MHPDWQNKTHQYCENNSSEEPEVLKRLAAYTWRKTVNPRQLSGHLQGRFLSQMVQLMQPKNIVEIGTFTGYATFCLWEKAPEDATITTIEADAETSFKCQEFWKRETQHKGIKWINANALDLLPSLNAIDFLFVDADKWNYRNYFDMALPRMSKNGLMLFDNTLWSGKLISEATDRDSQNMHDFNQYLQNHPQINVTLLPLRDGLSMVSLKS
jgi:caffeoyl-CoA O-methyltransferase